MTSRRRLWLFRLMAVALSLSPLFIAEAVCRVLDVGHKQEHFHPEVGFEAIHPLFELSEDKTRFEIAENRLSHFRPDSFAATKGETEFRIFVLGGSTVQGRPYSIETSFTTWLQLSLNAAEPTRDWRVVNCGGISYASYRLQPILSECLKHEPDLILIYTGHNEFLESQTFANLEKNANWISTGNDALSNSRFYNLVRQRFRGSEEFTESQEVLPAEVSARLDYQDGLKEYRRDPIWRQNVIEQYRNQIRAMHHEIKEAGVRVFFLNPTENLQTPPFKSVLGDTSEDVAKQKQIERLISMAAETKEHDSAIAILDQAIELDEHFALTYYHIGLRYAELGDYDKAKTAFTKAIEEDICPLRMLPSMHADLREEIEASLLIDIQSRFESESVGGITGDAMFVDHVHPTINGHQIIAEEVMNRMSEAGIVTPQPDWHKQRELTYQSHLDSLNFAYFERGRQQREGLRRWTHGESPLKKE